MTKSTLEALEELEKEFDNLGKAIIQEIKNNKLIKWILALIKRKTK